jgi:hypothetical protein
VNPSGQAVLDHTVWTCRRSTGRTIRLATAPGAPKPARYVETLKRPTANGAYAAVVRQTQREATDGSGTDRLQVIVRSSTTRKFKRFVTIADVAFDRQHFTRLIPRRMAVAQDGRTITLVRTVTVDEVREEIRSPGGEVIDSGPPGTLAQVQGRGNLLTWRHCGQLRQLAAIRRRT